jgi:NAD(P)-dependent dehydrogenase (short-subunit alcohol dehydrogenase family)
MAIQIQRKSEARKSADGWGFAASALVGIGVVSAAVGLFSKKTKYSFSKKVVLITGGSRGLGLILARELVDEGARVVICARDGEELTRAASELRDRGGDVLDVVCDVRNKEQCENTVRRCLAEFGRLDVLINNAGVIQTGPLESQTEDDFRDSMDTHFWGPYYMTNAALESLKKAGDARIINIASIGGKIAVPHLAPYCASKFALAGLSSAWRVELAKEGIAVTTICPGLMRTGSHVNAQFKGQHKKEFALFSIMDALPISSISAERAARQILEASRNRRAEAVISLQAQVASSLHAAFPEASAELLAGINHLLPSGNGSKKKFSGHESTSVFAPSILTANIDAEAKKNNELTKVPSYDSERF